MLETHVLSKVNESLPHRQFVKFLDDNNKVSQFQSGNRKHHSTETALLSATDDLLKAMDEKKISTLVLMDMSKAFDRVNHDMLLSKFRSLGVSPWALEWFKEGASTFVLGMWFRSLSQLIIEFHKGPFLAFFCLLFI